MEFGPALSNLRLRVPASGRINMDERTIQLSAGNYSATLRLPTKWKRSGWGVLDPATSPIATDANPDHSQPVADCSLRALNGLWRSIPTTERFFGRPRFLPCVASTFPATRATGVRMRRQSTPLWEIVVGNSMPAMVNYACSTRCQKRHQHS